MFTALGRIAAALTTPRGGPCALVQLDAKFVGVDGGEDEILFPISSATICTTGTPFQYELRITSAEDPDDEVLLALKGDMDLARTDLSMVEVRLDFNANGTRRALVFDTTRGPKEVDAFVQMMCTSMFESEHQQEATPARIDEIMGYCQHAARQGEEGLGETIQLLEFDQSEARRFVPVTVNAAVGFEMVGDERELQHTINVYDSDNKPAYSELVTRLHSIEPINASNAVVWLSNNGGVMRIFQLRFGVAGQFEAFWKMLSEKIYEAKSGKSLRAKALAEDMDWVIGAMAPMSIDDDVEHGPGMEFDGRDEVGDVSEDDSEDDSEEDDGFAISSPVGAGDRAGALELGTKVNRAFVQRGNFIDVHAITHDGIGDRVATPLKITTPYKGRPGEMFTPTKLMLHDDEQSLLMLDPSRASSVFKMDLNRGEVIEEWKVRKNDVDILARDLQTAIEFVSTVGGNSRSVSYKEMQHAVSRLAGGLTDLGVTQGDRVIIYMPQIPETAMAMLACARIGAVHSVVFGGFAAKELAVRIDDAQPKAVITASCGLEGQKGAIAYMPLVGRALELANHHVPSVVVVQRPEPAARPAAHALVHGRDHDFWELVEASSPSPCLDLPSSAPLYTIYTSGTTGDPKGILRDNSHAVMLKWTMRGFYGMEPSETFFAASDMGWVVGHSYIVYGPMLHGCTSLMFEGKPVGTPDAGVYWKLVEQHKVRALFTAPTALRAIRREDPTGELLRQHDLSSLRALFVAGERADPDTVQHFQSLLGVPVVDHWWQTESGSPMCGMLDDKVGTVPGSCGLPLPGFDVRVLDPLTGAEKAAGETGAIAIKLPLPPGFMATIAGNDARCRSAYLEEFPGYYSAGDAGFKDENGYVSIMSRTDDVMNVAGHRLSSGALEEACLAHPRVVECAVVGAHDDVKGAVPVALVVVTPEEKAGAADVDVQAEVVAVVRERVGAVAALKKVAVVAALPKTRSGKILRNVLRAMVNGEEYKLPGTIESTSVIPPVADAIRSIGYGKQA